MRRTPIQPGKGFRSNKERKTRPESALARSGNYSGSTLKRGTKRLRKVGKGGRESARALRVFKRECARQGVEPRCERRGRNCTGTEQLTWAHGRKRRLLKGDELERFAIVCCVNCHREMDEGMSHEQMADEVERIIRLRPERRLEAA